MQTSRPTTLIIADELALVREALSRLCESHGTYQTVGQCSDGLTAYDMIASRAPDVALVDFNLPRVFCLELIRRVRDFGGGTKVIVMGTRHDRKMALEVLRSGASGFVLKSAPAAMLLEALDRVSRGGLYVPPELEIERAYLQHRRPAGTGDPVEMLSSREYQVFQLLVDGIRAKEIAFRLNLSPKTIDTYRASLMRKLDIYDVAGLVKFSMHRDMAAPRQTA
jgi:DNA-binding NarL/FixJ family response regulator